MSAPVWTRRGLPARFRDLPRCPFFGNKIAHPTRASAVDHADHMNTHSRLIGRPEKYSVRMCHICPAYHVGRRRKARRADRHR